MRWIVLVLAGCGGYYYDSTTGDYEPCCKQCGETSQACGDSCISNDFECHEDPGCACG